MHQDTPLTSPPIPSVPEGNDLEAFLDREEPFFAEFSGLFSLASEHRYLVASQKGSMPLPVLARFKDGLDRIARDPFPVFLEPPEETRAKIARGYGATSDEIAIARNTTDAVSLILHGIHWEPGDAILCSTLEYPSCVATVLHVASRFGLRIEQFGVPAGPDTEAAEILASARRAILRRRPRVMFFSCPTQPNGIALPYRGLGRLAREHGVTTVVDGAHYGGMFDPRLDETGIDFWALSGHKWQCGPGGTGILYARNARHPANDTAPPRFHLVRSGSLDAPVDGARPADFDIGAALSTYGFPESADWRALGESCALWDRIGRRRIQDYILGLAAYARGRLREAFGPNCLLQPVRDPELLSGIVAFNPFPEPGQRRDLVLCKRFQERIYADFGYHLGCAGLGSTGLTRPPDPEAAAFPEGCVPNRDPETNAPAPGEVPLRIGTPAWLNRKDLDRFVGDCRLTVDCILADQGCAG